MNDLEETILATMREVFSSSESIITYRSGSSVVQLPAVKAPSSPERTGEEGRYLTGWGLRFIVWRKDLPELPRLGDQLTDAEDRTYAVSVFQGKPHYEYSDPYEHTVTIYVKRI